jgi:hypothetical protein
MPSVATTPGRMEILSRALDRAVASAVVPRLRIDELRSSFMATDAQGRSWTIDPESHRWGWLDGERWMVEEPPPQLFMDSGLRASLETLEAMAARAIMTGTDGLNASRTPWFRTPVAPAEPGGMRAATSSRESDATPQPPRVPEQALVTEGARSSASMPARVSVETTPVPEPVIATQAPTPFEETAPSRPAIPEAHRRFAGPAFAPVPDDAATPAAAATVAPAPPRGASHDHQRWLPTSIAPRLATVRPGARDDRAHAILCGLLATLFFALAVWKDDGRGYAASFLFGLLAVTLLILNLGRSRHD